MIALLCYATWGRTLAEKTSRLEQNNFFFMPLEVPERDC